MMDNIKCDPAYAGAVASKPCGCIVYPEAVEGKVSFSHLRSMQKVGDKYVIDSTGGATIAYTTDGQTHYAAVAFCNPKDNYNRHYGRAKSKGRLVQLMLGNKEADDDKFFTAEGISLQDFAARVRDSVGTVSGYRNRAVEEAAA